MSGFDNYTDPSRDVGGADFPGDELDRSLNQQIDRAMKHEKLGPKKESRYHDEDVSSIAKRILRCCDEIRSVVPLVAPQSSQAVAMSQMDAPEQDDRVGNAARDLLVYEAEVLMDLVDALVDKE